MPNIIIDTYCNLSCPYCFANSIKTGKNNISLEQLNYILSWLARDNNAKNNSDFRLGLIGGEPTLHPQFSIILKQINSFCNENNCQSVLFTNGIELYNFIEDIPFYMGILINYNNPQILTLDQQKKLDITLNELISIPSLKKRTALGCNLYLENQNYNFFWKAVDKYFIKNIRVSVTAPNKLKYNKDEYYILMKNIFLNFVDNAKKMNRKIYLDCNQIPLCFFNDNEIEKIQSVLDEDIKYCKICLKPSMDINFDYTAISCFGNQEKVFLNDFYNYNHLNQYFMIKNALKINKNIDNKCKNCKDFNNYVCQGGCLAFK